MTNIDYYGIAIHDLEFLNINNFKINNNTAVLCQQVIEKLLKSLLELVIEDSDKPLLTSHNLVNIYNYIISKNINIQLNKGNLSLVKDVYFTGRYPGRDFVFYTEDDIDMYLDTVFETLNEVNRIRESYSLDTVKIYRKQNNTYSKVFEQYRNKYNIIREEEWIVEYNRLAELCKSKSQDVVANYIENYFL